MNRLARYAPEVRERAVRMVLEHQSGCSSQWAAIGGVKAKIGCRPETLRIWVRQAERDQGLLPGATTDDKARLKQLEKGNPSRPSARTSPSRATCRAMHVDVKYLPQLGDETRRRYLFVAIDRATRWVYLAVKNNKSAASARAFLNALHKACPIARILTDNGKEFTDRLFGSNDRQPTGEHAFDTLCEALGIEHRLTKPRTPQTHGMVERFKGRISEVLATRHFRSGEELEATLQRYAWLYNHHLSRSALDHISPIEAMKRWQGSHPHLFHERVTNHWGPDR